MKTKRVKRLLSLFLAVCLAVSLAPGVLAYSGTGYCQVCRRSYSYTLKYGNETDATHQEIHTCSNCGYDQLAGLGTISNHNLIYYSAAYDQCTYCGMLISRNGPTCAHTNFTVRWNGCDWQKYCKNCGYILDSGTTHMNYTYGAWQYYTDSLHSRLKTCGVCGQNEWEDVSHNYFFNVLIDDYNEIGHRGTEICLDCGHSFSTFREEHTWLYGNWMDENETQHSKKKYCQFCNYKEYSYEDHDFVAGAWQNIYHVEQHMRTKVCSVCGRDEEEYANHSFDNPAWQSCSETHHNRTKHCTECGFGAYEYEEHVFSQRSVASISDTAHRITVSCACGEQQITDANHVDSNGDGNCDDCGSSMSRFSVTIPASLALAVNEYGVVSTATNAAVVNNSTAAVKVTSVTASTSNGWTLVPFDSSMASAKVDSKQIGFQINDAGSTRTGTSETLSIGSGWSISRGASLPLRYDAVVSATSETIRNEQVLTLLFVVDWAS